MAGFACLLAGWLAVGQTRQAKGSSDSSTRQPANPPARQPSAGQVWMREGGMDGEAMAWQAGLVGKAEDRDEWMPPGRVCTPTNSGILEPCTGGLEWTRAKSQNAVTEARATEPPRQGKAICVWSGAVVQCRLPCLALSSPCPEGSAGKRTCFNNKLLSSVGEGWAAAIGPTATRQAEPSTQTGRGGST
ncbi:hypothetical protein COCSADRAFT_194420 [Bipolaris sorokiniana ND90Pr]|uniref:Uncharacterized protein n=1 Tax=Cochliobolus sativus (strain ND90Pr / ATCC 201652) TaxID=665912 RepID=M2SPG2_COCSN|nr:uncharacterized protein COCSADRAFT_194420 [Bipolaris sorokiniana ND90Pr]EMD59031.1 hypothetical protein COCSADRAFT_194420 [Bipolaris sorokiniana ND90Pr]